MDQPAILAHQLEELNLLKCSLLPGEEIVFVPLLDAPSDWSTLLATYAADPGADISSQAPTNIDPARFQVKAEAIPVWFDVLLDPRYNGTTCTEGHLTVSARGADLGRTEQARWNAVIQECVEQVQDNPTSPSSTPTSATPTVRYHALLTSHHLKSPNKRRSLQQWSHELSIHGFAKVGYPGVIYCEGEQAQVEEFVGNVKTMQWLALRVRFVESLADHEERQRGAEIEKKRWSEFEKVGEVVEEMKRLGRTKYVVEMGIGSAGTSLTSPKG
ncbi:hypothetical protein IEO21_06157 [Rhodonia placenta]|uniref:Small nuclear ribonucleoprotein Prp3 C-terminal domain-containing protein n=1 Tax=Rhodonia placenta TaxID=104341 RepID=A0A8H7U1D9_9APHY|nr:hypothetical protein IEO21_06157 [Postia placenta]